MEDPAPPLDSSSSPSCSVWKYRMNLKDENIHTRTVHAVNTYMYNWTQFIPQSLELVSPCFFLLPYGKVGFLSKCPSPPNSVKCNVLQAPMSTYVCSRPARRTRSISCGKCPKFVLLSLEQQQSSSVHVQATIYQMTAENYMYARRHFVSPIDNIHVGYVSLQAGLGLYVCSLHLQLPAGRWCITH